MISEIFLQNRNLSEWINDTTKRGNILLNDNKAYRKKIDDTLNKIQGLIGKVDSKILFEELENISKYRPLTSLYFNALAEVYLYEKRYDEVFSTLSGKENWWYPSPYAAQSAYIFSKAFSEVGDSFHSDQYKVLECYLSEIFKSNGEAKLLLEEYSHEMAILSEKFLNNDEVVHNSTTEMYILATKLWRFFEGAIMLILERKLHGTKNTGYDINSYTNEFRIFEPNIGFFIEQITTESEESFLLIADESNDISVYLVLAKALGLLGRKVTLIANTVQVEVENNISISDTVDISIDNKEFIDGYELIRPIELVSEGDFLENNTLLIIDRILLDTSDEYTNLLTTRGIFDYLSDDDAFNMRVQCLSTYRGNYCNDFLAFGYIGRYTSYINRIYNLNYLDEISDKSECSFSIVIPARNSAYTLQYTLQTCLEQRGMSDDEYEIIISDNSDRGNNDILNLVQKLNDRRIRYFRTPRNLHLTRSFEYAFSKARGEFIIPIGSDDAILPWGLETLKRCISLYPDDDIFAWKRGFFQWSDSKSSSQAGRFVIPDYYKKNVYRIHESNCKSELKQIIDSDAVGLYGLPMLYINSGFRRRYLTKILTKTGRVLNGYSQDIFMGILSLLINDRYINIDYPITIAGMSDGSLGAKSLIEKVDNQALAENYKSLVDYASFGVPVAGRMKFAFNNTDTALFWSQLLYFLEDRSQRETLQQLLDNHDWIKTLKAISSKLSVVDLDYYMSLTMLRFGAFSLGKDIGDKFDKEIFVPEFENVYQVTENKAPDNYFTGFGDPGLALDARKFNVSNVYEASKLFENIANL